MSRFCPTPKETGDALYEANIVTEILKGLATGANSETHGGVALTSILFLTDLLEKRLDLIEQATRARGIAE